MRSRSGYVFCSPPRSSSIVLFRYTFFNFDAEVLATSDAVEDDDDEDVTGEIEFADRLKIGSANWNLNVSLLRGCSDDDGADVDGGVEIEDSDAISAGDLMDAPDEATICEASGDVDTVIVGGETYGLTLRVICGIGTGSAGVSISDFSEAARSDGVSESAPSSSLKSPLSMRRS